MTNIISLIFNIIQGIVNIIFICYFVFTRLAYKNARDKINSIAPSKKNVHIGGAEFFKNSLDHRYSWYYTANNYYYWKSSDSLHIISHFKTYQQTTDYTCGCASALMVINYFGNNSHDEMDIAKIANTDPSKGSTVEGLVNFFNILNYNVEFNASAKPAFEDIEQAEKFIIDSLDKNIPIIVDWVDWAGHWSVIIGIDTMDTDSQFDDVLIIADPYDITDHLQDGYFTVPFGRFFDQWREGKCAQKDTPYEQPYIKAWPKDRQI